MFLVTFYAKVHNALPEKMSELAGRFPLTG